MRQRANGVAASPAERHNARMRVSEAIGGGSLWTRRLSWATAAGIALGIAGPFGSYLNDAAVARVAYWTGLLWIGTLLLGVTAGPAIRLAPRLQVSRWFAGGVATLLACVPMAAVVASVTHAAWPWLKPGLGPLDWYAQTLCVAAPLVALGAWAERPLLAPSAPLPAPPLPSVVSPGSPLGRRPVAEILCLQMEDHYVRVHHAGGSELVLLPLNEAILGLGDRAGLQVHRSWWVARDAVGSVLQQGRGAALVLTNGIHVPIARSRVAELRAAGWLGGAAAGDLAPDA